MPMDKLNQAESYVNPVLLYRIISQEFKRLQTEEHFNQWPPDLIPYTASFTLFQGHIYFPCTHKHERHSV